MDNQNSTQQRRSFLQTLGAGAAVTALMPLAAACNRAETPPKEAVDVKTVKSDQPAPHSPNAEHKGGSWMAANAPMSDEKYPFELPPLDYAVNALEPHIDAMTMEIHHDRHHAGYTKKLNAALENHPELQRRSIGELLSSLDVIPAEVRTAVRNNGGGYYNHKLFWKIMSPTGGGQPQGALLEMINRDFGSYAEMLKQFDKKAATVFGSGWAWLVVNKENSLEVVQSANQDNPMSQGMRPLLGIDVWEHAYYLKYQNKRTDYISAFAKVINWEQVAGNIDV